MARAEAAEEVKAEDKAREANAKAFLKQHTGEDFETKDMESRITIVNPNTPEGMLAVALAKEFGIKTLPMSMLG